MPLTMQLAYALRVDAKRSTYAAQIIRTNRIMQKQLRKPANWQDFESLCKKLWGEIWQVPTEIKKNGRSGQAQAGVDVYAVPKGETAYWGIQCKGKDDYTDAGLTRKEVDSELAKAQRFLPPLAVFIYATTANKDVALEEYVRQLDLQSRAAGGPKVLLYCWEDIAELVDEHRDTHNWYLGLQQFANKFDFDVCFAGGEKELVISQVFIKEYRQYKLDPDWNKPALPPVPNPLSNPLLVPGGLAALDPYGLNSPAMKKALASFTQLTSNQPRPEPKPLPYKLQEIEFRLTNSGGHVIEDWKIVFDLDGQVWKLIESLPSPYGPSIPSMTIYCGENQIRYSPLRNTPLVQGDGRSLTVYLAPMPQDYSISIHWELLARDYSTSGDLVLVVKPEFETEYKVQVVNKPEDVREPELIAIRAKRP